MATEEKSLRLIEPIDPARVQAARSKAIEDLTAVLQNRNVSSIVFEYAYSSLDGRMPQGVAEYFDFLLMSARLSANQFTGMYKGVEEIDQMYLLRQNLEMMKQCQSYVSSLCPSCLFPCL